VRHSKTLATRRVSLQVLLALSPTPACAVGAAPALLLPATDALVAGLGLGL
jgi:hypothetical protein